MIKPKAIRVALLILTFVVVAQDALQNPLEATTPTKYWSVLLLPAMMFPVIALWLAWAMSSANSRKQWQKVSFDAPLRRSNPVQLIFDLALLSLTVSVGHYLGTIITGSAFDPEAFVCGVLGMSSVAACRWYSRKLRLSAQE